MAKALQLSGYSDSQIALIRTTVAKDCNDQEFNLFFEAARSYGLDPFRKQISALVFNKDKPDRRQMAIIVGRDGLRAIAQRCGNYRPASEPAEIEVDPSLVSPANPRGIVKATVRLWQRHGTEWFPVSGEAYWDEFAPVFERAEAYDWVDTGEVWPDTGKPKKKKVPKGEVAPAVEGNWARMPVVMITKCAEAQALRAGWPDTFGSLYVEEEMEAAQADMTATDAIEARAERERFERIGGKDAITMSFAPSGTLERVALGKMADRCLEYVREAEPQEAVAWSIRNRAGLQEFWAASPSDALEVKKAVEAKEKALKAAIAARSADDLPGVREGARNMTAG